MAEQCRCAAGPGANPEPCEASSDLLAGFLKYLHERNKDNLARNFTNRSADFKDESLVEYVLLITKELRLDSSAGFHALQLLQRFMVKHLADLLASPAPEAAAAEDAVFERLQEKFPLIIFSCVQIASKLSSNSHIIDNSTAVRFLDSLGYSATKRTLLESEQMVLKGLEFRLNPPNPQAYVAVLLEVLEHNGAAPPVERLHPLCHHVLHFISLQRAEIYDSLLISTTESLSPSREQRVKFAAVTEDCMLLGVCVVAVATFILYFGKYEQVVTELSHITAISRRNIAAFASATLMRIVGDPAASS